jgi:predicted DNA-binding transcriptional regulator AlpA
MSDVQLDCESDAAYLKRVADYDPETDKLMKVSDILKMLDKVGAGVSRQTFDRWVSVGDFPPPNLQFGKQRKWTERRVKEWLRSCVEKAKR